MRQYHSIKTRYPHALVLFRLGDFYELFYEDAIAASRELQITLTSRNRERGEPVPMCGVPYHAAEGYIARLFARRLQNRRLRPDGTARARKEARAARSRSRHHARHGHQRQCPRTQGE